MPWVISARRFPWRRLILSPRDFVSLEVSSFQLERIVKFKPQGGAYPEPYPDHLDRYKDMSSI